MGAWIPGKGMRSCFSRWAKKHLGQRWPLDTIIPELQIPGKLFPNGKPTGHNGSTSKITPKQLHIVWLKEVCWSSLSTDSHYIQFQKLLCYLLPGTGVRKISLILGSDIIFLTDLCWHCQLFEVLFRISPYSSQWCPTVLSCWSTICNAG